MHQPGTLICWNCGKRTIPGVCMYCKAELKRPAHFNEKKELKPTRNIIEIRKRGKMIIQLDLDKLSKVVANYFTIKQSLLVASPEFLVVKPEEQLDQKFTQLMNRSNELLNGLTPKIQKVKGSSDNLIIKYIYVEPINTIERRKHVLLIAFTFISMLFAGLYNYTKYLKALDKNLDGPKIFNVVLSVDSISSALLFSITLLFILIIKDFIQIYTAFKQDKIKLSTYFLPAPPIFELGTLGSFLHQRTIHRDKNSLFNTVLYGPIIGWIISSIVIIISLHLAIYDPQAAQNYASHSVVAQGSFEPLGLKVLAYISVKFGYWDGNWTEPITNHYLLHPVTIAGLAGFYLSGISLFPASHLNGGYLIRAKFGERTHIISSYLIIFALIWVHWLIAIFLLFINNRLGVPEILNEESKLPKSSNYGIIVAFIIVLLTFPFRI